MSPLSAGAAESARHAAVAAGVEIELVDSADGARAAAALFGAVWPGPPGEPVEGALVRALAHSGNYVSLATCGTDVVGASLAFRAADREGPFVHSHIAGVVTGMRGRGVGFALKQHQRAWALGEGFERVTWTFDPLVVRNAFFNVVKLGAELTGYLVDFYGRLDDGINVGGESDRCLVRWMLESPRAVAAAERRVETMASDDLRRAGATVALAPGSDGAPRTAPLDGVVAMCRVPDDIVDLRHRDLLLAGAWREAARTTFLAAFEGGWRVRAVTRDGWYAFERTGLR